MIKETITYVNYNGETVTEDLYFHMSKRDIIKLQLSANGALQEQLQKIVDSNDGQVIVDKFEEYILMSYGFKDPDGRRFHRGKEISDDFAQTEAYSEFFTKLTTNAGFAAKFIDALFPTKLMEEIIDEMKKSNPQEVIDVELPEVVDVPASEKQLREMSKEELLEAFKKRNAQ